MAERILITGGAGFIGTSLAHRLVAQGFKIRIVDSLLTQVHGPNPSVPTWIKNDCEFILGDVRNADIVNQAIKEVDYIIHLAADTGTAQSMSEVRRYADVNVNGTAVLLESCISQLHNLKKLVLASSRAVYGEGKYHCGICGIVYPRGRSRQALDVGRWEPACPSCGGSIKSCPTDEVSLPSPNSIYGATKLAQENLVSAFASAFGLPHSILRYQNVYGHGQSLINPYTGILTHFYSTLRHEKAPSIFEDGKQTRDFVHVDDIVEGTYRALITDAQGVFNLGSGKNISILGVAIEMCLLAKPDVKPALVSEYRVGDIRHSVADITRANSVLGYTPAIELPRGLLDFITWADATWNTTHS